MIWLNTEFRNAVMESIKTGVALGEDAQRIKSRILDSISPEDFGYDDLGMDGSQAVDLYFQSLIDMLCEVIDIVQEKGM